VATTGIAELTLGGGVGWLVRKHGLACDNLLSLDLITADGVLRTVSSEQHDDLFWALRGGQSNVGVVTSLEYRLHEVGPVTGGMLLHPADRAADVFAFYREFIVSAPEDLTLYCGMLSAPDGTPVVALIGCHSGPAEEAHATVEPLRTFGPPIVDCSRGGRTARCSRCSTQPSRRACAIAGSPRSWTASRMTPSMR